MAKLDSRQAKAVEQVKELDFKLLSLKIL